MSLGPRKFDVEEAFVLFAFSQFARGRELNVSWVHEVLAQYDRLSENSYESVRRIIHGVGVVGGASGFVQTDSGPVILGSTIPVKDAWRIDALGNIARYEERGWTPYLPHKADVSLVPLDVRRKYLEFVAACKTRDVSLLDCAESWKDLPGLVLQSPETLLLWMKTQASVVQSTIPRNPIRT